MTTALAQPPPPAAAADPPADTPADPPPAPAEPAAAPEPAAPAVEREPTVGPAAREVKITAPSGWQLIDFAELYAYRDLFRFLVWRGIKVRYAQSAIGIGWAVIQPLFSVVVFSIVFGRFAGLDSGAVPYAVFSLAAMLPWTYFSNTVTEGAGSLVTNANLITKVYFPRLVLPLSASVAKLVDFGIAAAMMVAALAFYRVEPNWAALPTLVPLTAVMFAAAAGCACWLTCLAVQYRDVNYAAPFLVQLLMYASPVIYAADIIPDRLRPLYALNPMVGVIGGYRAALLGDGPMPWADVATGAAVAAALLLSGMAFFRRKERVFADVA